MTDDTDADDGESFWPDDALHRALVSELSDAEPPTTASFDDDDWIQYAKAALLDAGIDPSTAVIIPLADGGVRVEPRVDYLRSKEELAASAELATHYLRRVDGVPVDVLEQLDDRQRVRQFLASTGYLDTSHKSDADTDRGDR